MISFSSVGKSYGDRTLFNDATFTLGRGERCGVIGRNGSGKSTLFRLITGEESLDEGNIIIPKGYRIGTLQQHIAFQHPTILAEAVSGLPEERCDEEYRAEIILTGLGFALKDMDRNPSELSGGFQLRLQLTKVLLSEPDCLLLDEPTNYLDIVAIRWLEQFLCEWPGELMLISHDRAFVDSIVTHTLGLYRQKVRRVTGDTEKFYSQMLMEEEIHGKTLERAEKKKAHMQSFVDRFGAKATKAAQARSRIKAIEKLPSLEQLVTMENLGFAFHAAPMPGTRMIEVENLSFSYAKPSTGHAKPFSFSGLSLAIEKGDRIAIVGKNGRGKSTLLSLIGGLLEPKSGTWWRSDNVRIGHFGQTNIQRLHPNMTVEEEVAAANPQLTYGEVRSICGQMLFSGDAAKKQISVLSGGERSRVLIGKILAMPCNLLLLDEPTHHLDMESVEALFRAIDNFSGSVVLVTHDETLLHEFAEKLVVCREEGITLFQEGYAAFLRKVGWEEKKEEVKVVEAPKRQRKSQEAINANKIKKVEEQIIKAEQIQSEAEKQLEEAVAAGDQQKVTKLSEQIGKMTTDIELLYSELEKLF